MFMGKIIKQIHAQNIYNLFKVYIDVLFNKLIFIHHGMQLIAYYLAVSTDTNLFQFK